jgi:multidrug efflux pump subunit AcrA (membrane-fusion protein)
LRIGGSISAEEFAAIRAPRIRSGSRSGGDGGSMTLIRMADAGSVIAKGEVIAEFDRQNQQQQIDDQQAGVVQAEALVRVREANLMIELETKRQDLVTARAEYEKARLDLRTAPVRSQIEAEVLANVRDEAQATYEQLEQEVKMLEQAHAAALRQVRIDLEQEEVDLKRAEMNAEHMLMTAPIGGIVVHETMFRGGGFSQVANGDEVRSGTLFMQIVNPGSMVLQAQVNQADSQRVRLGQRAEVRLDAYPNEVFQGRVRSVSAMAGGGSDGRFRSGSGDHVRQISVTIDILEQDARIIPDLSASADVLLDVHENVVTAPREALDRIGEDYFVWVRNAAATNGAERRQVQVGALNDTHAEITDGLSGSETMEIRVQDAAALRGSGRD